MHSKSSNCSLPTDTSYKTAAATFDNKKKIVYNNDVKVNYLYFLILFTYSNVCKLGLHLHNMCSRNFYIRIIQCVQQSLKGI